MTEAKPDQVVTELEEEIVETPESEVEETAEEAAPEGEAAKTKASEVEALALEMGWDPKKSKSATEWIRDGSVIQRNLKNKNDDQSREFQERLDRLDRTNQKTMQLQRRQLEDAYNNRMREAVTLADMEAFDKAQTGKTAALKKFDDEVEELPERKGQAEKPPPEVLDFAKRNSWFDVDDDMTDVAVNISKRLLAKYPDMPLSERLEKVEAEIKRKFPNEFNGQSTTERPANGAKAPVVEGGLRAIKTSTAKGWEALPAEAKQVGLRNVKDGLFKTKEDYATAYWEQ